MTGSHRSAGSRRKKSNTGRIATAAALTAVLGAGAVCAVVLIVKEGETSPAARSPAVTGSPSVPAPEAGEPVALTSTDGFTYRIAAVGGGRKVNGQAYIDYTITNTGPGKAPMERPGDLFLDRGKTLSGSRCMEQPGAEKGKCTLENSSTIIGYVDGAPPLVVEGADEYIPAGASYLIRISTRERVKELTRQDLALYVWDVRFIEDRKARLIPFP
ncbi:hypothetical protein ABGB12_07315 [Actinocorallia sp. B10E7]|uniref:hypothetical protein n=1 Tax=Actinocorallia sp. B10E7 TaxID=3153558 RepID=UPI00325CED91